MALHHCQVPGISHTPDPQRVGCRAQLTVPALAVFPKNSATGVHRLEVMTTYDV